MALTIISPANSFVRFNEDAAAALCIWGIVDYCLPVYDQSDVYFQFVIDGTEAEIDSMCTQDESEIELALVSECNGAALLTFSQHPQRFRLSLTQVLYNWVSGFPNFESVINTGQCFKVQITVTATPYGYPEEQAVWCSNCFERIADECFTSVVEYGNEEDGFGFKYCYGGNLENGSDLETCEPTVVTFASVATLAIPYTAVLSNKYGPFPTVQVWIYDGTGQLLNMGITASFDTYPPTMLNFDFGGVSSGIIVIR